MIVPEPGSIGYLRAGPTTRRSPPSGSRRRADAGTPTRRRTASTSATTTTTTVATTPTATTTVPTATRYDCHRDHAGRDAATRAATTTPTATARPPRPPTGDRKRDRRRDDSIAGRSDDRAADRPPVRLLPAAVRLAIGRAAWVQGVQGGGLSADAQSQHTQTVDGPGLSAAGSSTARAGSWPSPRTRPTSIATPYQVKDPPRTAREARADARTSPSTTILNERSAIGSSGFAYLAREVDLATAEQDPQARARRDRHGAVEPADLSGGQARRPGDRDRRESTTRA